MKKRRGIDDKGCAYINLLSDIEHKYNFFIVDVVGVIHDGINSYKMAIDCINNLIINNKTVIFLTNSARVYKHTEKKLSDLGVFPGFKVITAGDIARMELQNRFSSQKIFHIGANIHKDLTHDININLVSKIEKANIVLLSAFLNNEKWINWVTKIIKKIIDLKFPVICVNPDISSPHGEETRLCAGFLAKVILDQGGTVHFTGKPFLPIYDNIFSLFPNMRIQKNRMLAIGDSLETDIKGANQFGIDSLLILSKNSGNNLGKEKDSLPQFLKKEIKPCYQPKFYTNNLVW